MNGCNHDVEICRIVVHLPVIFPYLLTRTHPMVDTRCRLTRTRFSPIARVALATGLGAGEWARWRPATHRTSI